MVLKGVWRFRGVEVAAHRDQGLGLGFEQAFDQKARFQRLAGARLSYGLYATPWGSSPVATSP